MSCCPAYSTRYIYSMSFEKARFFPSSYSKAQRYYFNFVFAQGYMISISECFSLSDASSFHGYRIPLTTSNPSIMLSKTWISLHKNIFSNLMRNSVRLVVRARSSIIFWTSERQPSLTSRHFSVKKEASFEFHYRHVAIKKTEQWRL